MLAAAAAAAAAAVYQAVVHVLHVVTSDQLASEFVAMLGPL